MNKKQITIKEFAELAGFDYLKASAIVALMVSTGYAKEVGKRSEGRGKPSTIFEIENEMHVKFWNDDGTEFADEPEKAEAPATEQVEAAELVTA